MKCPANPIIEKFLFWNIETFGSHNIQISFIEYDHFFKEWKIHYQCNYCGATEESEYLNDFELLQAAKLNKVPEKGYYSRFNTYIDKEMLKNYRSKDSGN